MVIISEKKKIKIKSSPDRKYEICIKNFTLYFGFPTSLYKISDRTLVSSIPLEGEEK